jgi:hypothetical protein
MKMSLPYEMPAFSPCESARKRVLRPVFLKRQTEIAEVLRLLVEGGDQSIHTWSGCREQGAALPLQQPNE